MNWPSLALIALFWTTCLDLRARATTGHRQAGNSCLSANGSCREGLGRCDSQCHIRIGWERQYGHCRERTADVETSCDQQCNTISVSSEARESHGWVPVGLPICFGPDHEMRVRRFISTREARREFGHYHRAECSVMRSRCRGRNSFPQCQVPPPVEMRFQNAIVVGWSPIRK